MRDKQICEHCGSTNTGEVYTEAFSNEMYDDFGMYGSTEKDLFDCLDCGESAQDA